MTNNLGFPPSPADTADRMAIGDILHLHSRGLDRGDPAALQSCYWPDGEVDYGAYKGPAQPFAELVVGALTEGYELTRHIVSNSLIHIAGNSARCESYVSADHLLPGASQELCYGGRYLDLLEKRDGQWRILHRQVVMDWARMREMEDLREGEAFAELAKGANGARDPLHNFLTAGGNPDE